MSLLPHLDKGEMMFISADGRHLNIAASSHENFPSDMGREHQPTISMILSSMKETRARSEELIRRTISLRYIVSNIYESLYGPGIVPGNPTTTESEGDKKTGLHNKFESEQAAIWERLGALDSMLLSTEGMLQNILAKLTGTP